jgi:hypothetical protein
METTLSSPLKSHAGGSTFPSFGAVKVTVSRARTAGPITSDESEAIPDGMSTAITGVDSARWLMT